LSGARDEFLLATTVQNLGRLAKLTPNTAAGTENRLRK
jgi:hypothetical protein